MKKIHFNKLILSLILLCIGAHADSTGFIQGQFATSTPSTVQNLRPSDADDNGPGSQVYCQEFPLDASCVGSDEYCQKFPLDTSCEGSDEYCQKFPLDASCEGSDEYCQKFPLDASCVGSDEYCQKFPLDAACQPSLCENNPRNPSCDHDHD